MASAHAQGDANGDREVNVAALRGGRRVAVGVNTLPGRLADDETDVLGAWELGRRERHRGF